MRRSSVRVHLGQHVQLLILLIQQILQFANFSFEGTHSFFKRLGISARERSSTQLVAGLALEADIGALGATRPNAIASYLLTSAAVAGLGNATLGSGSHLDHFHG